MANMSYCRYRNTLAALRDCADDLRDYTDLEQIADEEEEQAASDLIKLCREIVADWDEDA